MLQKLIGSNDLSSFAAAFFFALIGVALSLLLQTTKRDINASGTPFHFSWSFFLADNIKRIAAGLILIYIAIRFYPELFGKPINEYLAFVVGVGLDKVAELIKNASGILQVNRDKIN
ncbi:MAG: hypothetical protein V4450_07495 [Bacteroidota bacterium]